MESKIAKYDERMRKVQVVIDEERAKIDDYMKAAFAQPSGGRDGIDHHEPHRPVGRRQGRHRSAGARPCWSTLELVARLRRLRRTRSFRARAV